MVMRPTISLCLTLAVCGPASVLVSAQDPEIPGRSSSRGPTPLTVQQQEALYDRLIARYMDRFTRVYSLTAEQTELVRSHLDELKASQVEYADALQKELNELQGELRTLRDRAREQGDTDRDRMREVYMRMREVREKSPLTSWTNVVAEIETLLPPDQVSEARAREKAAPVPSQDGRTTRRNPDEPGGRPAAAGDLWDRYAAEFKRRYELDEPQIAAVDSAVRELKGRREANRQAYVDAGAAADRETRRQKYLEFLAANEALFRQLRTTLDTIPTVAQKNKGGAMPAAMTQPATPYWWRQREAPASAPAAASTRPGV